MILFLLSHPSKAQIGQGCVIGPFCVLGENVVLGTIAGCIPTLLLTATRAWRGQREFFPSPHRTQNAGPEMEGRPCPHPDWRPQHLPGVRYHPQRHRRRGSHHRRLAQPHSGLRQHRATMLRWAIMSSCPTSPHWRGIFVVEDYAVIGAGGGCISFAGSEPCPSSAAVPKWCQDVPPYMLADGNPARTRTVNKVGLERHGVAEEGAGGAQTVL